MRRDHSPGFDDLEGRRLLSTAHPAATATATAGQSLMISGMLAVDMKAATQTTNPDDSTTTSAPVSGHLGTLGKVTGVWSETFDSYGDYEGPDTVQITVKGVKGAFTLSFNNNNTGKATLAGHGTSFYQHGQQLTGSSGSFAKDTEKGSIEVIQKNSNKTVSDLELFTVPPS